MYEPTFQSPQSKTIQKMGRLHGLFFSCSFQKWDSATPNCRLTTNRDTLPKSAHMMNISSHPYKAHLTHAWQRQCFCHASSHLCLTAFAFTQIAWLMIFINWNDIFYSYFCIPLAMHEVFSVRKDHKFYHEKRIFRGADISVSTHNLLNVQPGFPIWSAARIYRFNKLLLYASNWGTALNLRCIWQVAWLRDVYRVSWCISPEKWVIW